MYMQISIKIFQTVDIIFNIVSNINLFKETDYSELY